MTLEEIERIKKEDPKLFRKLLRERRKECDDGFFYQILEDIQKAVQEPLAFVGYTLLALIFYGAVRSLGWVYFNSLSIIIYENDSIQGIGQTQPEFQS